MSPDDSGEWKIRAQPAVASAPPRSMAGLSPALAGLAAALGLFAHLSAVRNPFVFDDHLSVLENASIRHLLNLPAVLLGNITRPVVNLSYAADYAVWGLQPLGYHLTSIALHVVNVLLFYHFVRAISRDRFDTSPSAERAVARPVVTAFSAAALFAVHPLMTQAVDYVSGRSEVLCGLFFLLALLSLRRWWLGGPPAWLGCGIVMWGLALASKETAAMLPFVLLAYDRLLLVGCSEAAHRRLARLHVPLIATVVLLGVARLAMLAFVESGPPVRFVWGNIFVSLGVVRRYVSMLAIPVGQSIFHGEQLVTRFSDTLAWFNLLWVVGLIVLAVRVRRREPLVTLGAVWVLLLIVPSAVLLIVDVGDPTAEQRAYLVSLGYFLCAGVAFAHVFEWPFRGRVAVRGIAAFGALLVLLAYLGATQIRGEVWSDPVRLWQEAVAGAPDIWVPYRGLGDALRERGDCVQAVRAYEQSIQLRPEPDTYSALAGCLVELGADERADGAWAEAARLSPHLADAYVGRGLVAWRAGRAEDAISYVNRAIAEDPRNAVGRLLLAEIYERAYGDPTTALRLCREASVFAPDSEEVRDCVRRNDASVQTPAAQPASPRPQPR